MKRLKLPDGTLLHPGRVVRVEHEKHMFRGVYYVQLLLDDGTTKPIRDHLSEPEAQEIRDKWEREIEHLQSGISAYKEGREAGLVDGRNEGYKTGYKAGRSEGYSQGRDEADHQLWQAGADAVLGEIRGRYDELWDEMRYEAHLLETRRAALIAMIQLLDDIRARFVPPTSSEEEPPPA